MSLHGDRGIIVNAIYDEVELPDSVHIMETDGWEHGEGGHERGNQAWTKVLYLENNENPDGDSVKALLTVSFYPNSVQVAEVTLDGEPLKVPAPY
jgi:hypothetical protein